MTDHKSTQDFYAKLPAFDDFREIADLDRYHALPDDWTLIVSDVVGSTKAIERGEYKNVNMVGAASITAVINVSDGVQLPFAFGGDGGLVAVPPNLLEASTIEMKRLQAASSKLFGLSLRAAAIPVSALRAAGAETLVRKYRLSEGNDLAMFSGTGPIIADEWLKSDEQGNDYALRPDDNEQLPDLDGLSCRWEPLSARNGTMLTVILQPKTPDSAKGIQTITNTIGNILGDAISKFAPVHSETMKYRFPPAGLALEIAAGASRSNPIRRTIWAYFTSLMLYFSYRFGILIGDFNGTTYREEVKTNTDYRKYDGSLRMVLDVSPDQATRIERYLEEEYQAGKVVYGTWQADRAMMTCLLFNLSDSQHVHFIDGADGGYAMAAKDLKLRILALRNVN